MNGWLRGGLLLAIIFSVLQAVAGKAAEKERYKLSVEYNKRYSAGPYSNGSYNLYESLGVRFFNSYLRYPVPLEDEFTFEDLVTSIEARQLTTVESVIEVLPEYMKNKNYVLMYRSRSLQEATPMAPRAILYTPTASLMLSFNGGENQMGSNTIEVIQFRLDKMGWEFRELQFDGKSIPKISEPNPKKCVECHQSKTRGNIDLRPNWEPYNIWIGAYGSDNGRFEDSGLLDDWHFQDRIRPEDHEALLEQSGELELFIRYINDVAPKHSRYSLLGKFSVKGPTDLTNHLSFWNSMRMVRLMKEEPAFEAYSDAVEFGVRCLPGKKYIESSEALKWHFSNLRYFDYSDRSSISVSQWITQIFEPLGIDTSDWSMDFGTGGRFAFRERFGSPANPRDSIRAAWQYVMAEKPPSDCKDLEERVAKDLDVLFLSGYQESLRQAHMNRIQPPTAGAILQRCARCHVEERESWIPHIPFDDPSKLAEILNRRSSRKQTLFHEIEKRTSSMATKKEQMPPAGRLSSDEYNVLMNYLREIRDEN